MAICRSLHSSPSYIFAITPLPPIFSPPPWCHGLTTKGSIQVRPSIGIGAWVRDTNILVAINVKMGSRQDSNLGLPPPQRWESDALTTELRRPFTNVREWLFASHITPPPPIFFSHHSSPSHLGAHLSLSYHLSRADGGVMITSHTGMWVRDTNTLTPLM